LQQTAASTIVGEGLSVTAGVPRAGSNACATVVLSEVGRGADRLAQHDRLISRSIIAPGGCGKLWTQGDALRNASRIVPPGVAIAQRHTGQRGSIPPCGHSRNIGTFLHTVQRIIICKIELAIGNSGRIVEIPNTTCTDHTNPRLIIPIVYNPTNPSTHIDTKPSRRLRIRKRLTVETFHLTCLG
jgi:hypothetical protein